jgi:hypothetical protein
MFNCHCRDCQRASGGAFVTVWTDRGFCPECGTPLFAKGEVAPGYISIKPGSLHDASWFKPTIVRRLITNAIIAGRL